MYEALTALAEPNRVRIVELLRDGPRSVSQIVEGLHMPQPLASKHLRVLREAGVVRAFPRAQQRVYELQSAPFKELENWVTSFRRVWEGRLTSLEAHLRDEKRKRRTA